MATLSIDHYSTLCSLRDSNNGCCLDVHVIHVISFSGGMGSFAEAEACVSKYGKENVITLFADTLIEDKDLYRFMKECSAFLGCQHITIAEGRTPFQVFEDVKFMGNSRIDPCSRILKRDYLDKFITRHWNFDEVEIHLGIDITEEHRLTRLQPRKLPYIYRSTLVEDGRMILKDYSKQHGITPPRLYSFGLGHNNCGGFCPKAGMGHYAKLLAGDRDQYLEHEAKEQAVYAAVPNAKPFLRETIDGELTYKSLKDFRLSIEDGKQLTLDELLDFGGCGCAI